MQSFKASYINELYKISKRKKVNVAVIMCSLLIILGAVISCTVKNFMGINITGKAEFAITVLPVFVSIVIPLFAIFVCIDMFCSEFSTNTVKTTLLVPASRFKIFCSKILAAITFVTAMLVFVMLVSFIISIVLKQTEFKIIKILASYIISIFPLTAICVTAALVSNIAKGSGSSFMICVIVYLVFKALELFNPQYSSFFFTSGLSMYIFINAPLISLGKIIRMILIMAGYSTMIFATGYFLFEKKEI